MSNIHIDVPRAILCDTMSKDSETEENSEENKENSVTTSEDEEA